MGIAHVIKVSTAANGGLDVNPPKLDVPKSGDPIVIVWWLKNAGNVVFGTDGTDDTGLTWHGSMPTGVFSEAVKSLDGTRILLDDSNPVSNRPQEEVVYELRAYDKVTKATYKTGLALATQAKSATQSLSPLTTTNPAIINK